ncbi:hypothetical protein TPY_3165 [Sulfobacillus acidophilus TPY]|nr:hypothetical protein TPY_3165 [Sulfobacillus acidophilus TPY]
MLHAAEGAVEFEDQYRVKFAPDRVVQQLPPGGPARRDYWTCPDCGRALQNPDTGAYWPRTINTPTRAILHCPFCHTPLWTADPA